MRILLVIGGTTTEKSLNVSGPREIALSMDRTSVKVIVNNKTSHFV